MRQGSVGDFFRDLEAEAGDRLPTWNGELYLELHRGTYTTQSRNKRANRKSEFLLHDAEFLAALAALARPGLRLPRRRAAPGLGAGLPQPVPRHHPRQQHRRRSTSSRRQQYAEIARAGRGGAGRCAGGARRHGGRRRCWSSTRPASPAATWPSGPAALPRPACSALTARPCRRRPADGGALDRRGRAAALQRHRRWLSPRRCAPAEPANRADRHARPCWRTTACASSSTRPATSPASTTRPTRARCCPPGAVANQFQAFEDRPMNWDAWDVDIFYDDKMWLADPADSVRVVGGRPAARHAGDPAAHPAQPATCSASRSAHNSPRLDFDTDHRLAASATSCSRWPSRWTCSRPTATYEIQWGNVAAAHPPQHQLGLGALRDLRPEVGGPERGRLRRQPAQRLQVRPRHPGQRDAPQPAAQPHHARPRGRPGRAPLRLQPAAARRRLGRGAPSPRPTRSTTR